VAILDERHLLAATSYVELNPVRDGIVKKAWAYPWSSASFHAGRSKTDPLVKKDRKLLNLVNNWDEFLAGATLARDEAIQQMTRTGRPAGDAAFVGLVERLTARNLTKGKPGRAVKKGR
jgi:putative transposase